MAFLIPPFIPFYKNGKIWPKPFFYSLASSYSTCIFIFWNFAPTKRHNTSKWRFFRDRFSFYLGNNTPKNTDWLSYIRLQYKRTVWVLLVYCEMKLCGHCSSSGWSCHFLFPSSLEVYWRNADLTEWNILGSCVYFYLLTLKAHWKDNDNNPAFSRLFYKAILAWCCC